MRPDISVTRAITVSTEADNNVRKIKELIADGNADLALQQVRSLNDPIVYGLLLEECADIDGKVFPPNYLCSHVNFFLNLLKDMPEETVLDEAFGPPLKICIFTKKDTDMSIVAGITDLDLLDIEPVIPDQEFLQKYGDTRSFTRHLTTGQLDDLETLVGLRKLQIGPSYIITEAEMDRLQKALPNCEIEHNPQEPWPGDRHPEERQLQLRDNTKAELAVVEKWWEAYHEHAINSSRSIELKSFFENISDLGQEDFTCEPPELSDYYPVLHVQNPYLAQAVLRYGRKDGNFWLQLEETNEDGDLVETLYWKEEEDRRSGNEPLHPMYVRFWSFLRFNGEFEIWGYYWFQMIDESIEAGRIVDRADAFDAKQKSKMSVDDWVLSCIYKIRENISYLKEPTKMIVD